MKHGIESNNHRNKSCWVLSVNKELLRVRGSELDALFDEEHKAE